MAKQKHIKTVVLPDSLRVASRELRGSQRIKQPIGKMASRQSRASADLPAPK